VFSLRGRAGFVHGLQLEDRVTRREIDERFDRRPFGIGKKRCTSLA
jgi:hypothetical protein